MVAGAVVGAVTGAARNVAHEAAAMPLTSEDVSAVPTHESSETPTTREVLSEMAGGAVLGAVAGRGQSGYAPETERRKRRNAASIKGKRIMTCLMVSISRSALAPLRGQRAIFVPASPAHRLSS